MYLRILAFSLIIISLACSKENVRTELDDAIGVVPEITRIDTGFEPSQIYDTRYGWIFISDKAGSFTRWDKNLVINGAVPMNGPQEAFVNRLITETPSGQLYRVFVDNGNQMLLENLDPNGNNLALSMLLDTLRGGRISDVWAENDSLLFITFTHKVSNSNDIHSFIYSYNLISKEIKKCHEFSEMIVCLAFTGNKETGYWMMLFWQTKPNNKLAQGSVFSFDTSWNVRHEFQFSDMSYGDFYSNRNGAIVMNGDGTADIFYPTEGFVMWQGAYYGLTHFKLDPGGQVVNQIFYPELYGHAIKDIIIKDQNVHVLSHETNGSNLTHHLSISSFQLDGRLSFFKYLRNTVGPWSFAAILEAEGDHATIVAYEKKNSSLMKISF
ncbi:MAG TPA: hypothetical protein DIW47_12625 [Bacteroidetes bacterium]|nr:hypothetical protein [Bacteroidota bacterium]